MEFLTRIIRFVDIIIESIGKVISWLLFVMVLVSFIIVVLRYGFNIGWIAMQESVLYMHGFIFMLGAAYTLKADGHVRVDIFYQKFSQKQRALVNIFGGLFLLLPVCVFIFYISFDYVQMSWRIMEQSPEAGGLPFVYFSKSFILLFCTFLSLQGLAEIMRNIIIVFSSKHTNNKGEQ
jgi:TRAP-type mannitol/chloroaromatic compound transport system permease small subunit